MDRRTVKMAEKNWMRKAQDRMEMSTIEETRHWVDDVPNGTTGILDTIILQLSSPLLDNKNRRLYN